MFVRYFYNKVCCFNATSTTKYIYFPFYYYLQNLDTNLDTRKKIQILFRYYSHSIQIPTLGSTDQTMKDIFDKENILVLHDTILAINRTKRVLINNTIFIYCSGDYNPQIGLPQLLEETPQGSLSCPTQATKPGFTENKNNTQKLNAKKVAKSCLSILGNKWN